jgi:hypothetical protein
MDIRLREGVASAAFDGKECLSKALALPTDGEILLRQTDMPSVDNLYEKTLGII